MDDGLQRRFADAERQRLLGMAVHHAVDVGSRFVEAAMDEALEIGWTTIVAHDFAIERELHDVALLDELGAARARQEKALGIGRVAHADMAIGVDHALMRQNAVGDDEVVECLFELTHGESLLAVVNGSGRS
jgi:hypothetical protein